MNPSVFQLTQTNPYTLDLQFFGSFPVYLAAKVYSSKKNTFGTVSRVVDSAPSPLVKRSKIVF